MKMAYRKIIVGLLVFSMTLGPAGIQSAFAGKAPGSSGSDYQAHLRQLIESGDVRYDETARNGTPVIVLANSDQFDAGLPKFVFAGLLYQLIKYKLLPYTYKSYKLLSDTIDLYHIWRIDESGIPKKVFDSLMLLLPLSPDEMVATAQRTSEQLQLSREEVQMLALGEGDPILRKKVEVAFLKAFIEVKAEVKAEKWRDVFFDVYVKTKETGLSIIAAGQSGWFSPGTVPVGTESLGSIHELVLGGTLASVADLDHWETKGALAGLSSFGPIQAPNSDAGSHFGLIHTGFGEASAEGRLDQTFISPRTSAATFAVRYNFVTTEFPEWLGSEFNDSFFIELVHVQTGAAKVLAKFEGSLNQIFSESDINSWRHVQFSGGLPFQILDRADTGAGQTGWTTTSKGNLYLYQGGLYKVQIRVNDVTDEIWDSALLIDKVSLR